jgi:hypothetical protein
VIKRGSPKDRERRGGGEGRARRGERQRRAAKGAGDWGMEGDGKGEGGGVIQWGGNRACCWRVKGEQQPGWRGLGGWDWDRLGGWGEGGVPWGGRAPTAQGAAVLQGQSQSVPRVARSNRRGLHRRRRHRTHGRLPAHRDTARPLAGRPPPGSTITRQHRAKSTRPPMACGGGMGGARHKAGARSVHATNLLKRWQATLDKPHSLG